MPVKNTVVLFILIGFHDIYVRVDIRPQSMGYRTEQRTPAILYNAIQDVISIHYYSFK